MVGLRRCERIGVAGFGWVGDLGCGCRMNWGGRLLEGIEDVAFERIELVLMLRWGNCIIG